MATYTLISSNVLTTTTASVTFSAIPSTYTDLVVRWSTRDATTSSQFYNRFNGATEFTYSNTRLTGTGSAATSDRSTSDAYIKVENGTDPSSATALTFSNGEMYIPNYNSTTSKQFSSFAVYENNATAAGIEITATLYTSANGITSMLFESQGSGYVSGSSFYLYGISNA
jgi:hypothetical protein